MLRFAGFELDQQRAELRGPTRELVRLRPKAFAMLQLFVANAGRVISKEELMRAVWPNTFVAEDSLFQCIREIRTALGDEQRQMIRLVSGHGYLFDAEVSSEPATPRPTGAEAVLAAPHKTATETPALRSRSRFVPFLRPVAAALIGICGVVGLAVAVPLVIDLGGQRPPTFAVKIVEAGNDPGAAAMAADITDDLTNGLANISSIRVLSPAALAGSASPDLRLEGKLQKDGDSWALQARLLDAADGEVGWATSVSVGTKDTDAATQQSRLVGGLGHELAVKINALARSRQSSPATAEAEAHAHVVVEQATAFINHTSRERFTAAQTMLEQELAARPDNIEVETALAGHLLRGVQSVWYSAPDAEEAGHRARSLVERALKASPDYLPALEDYCRLLTATNEFADALVACAHALTFDPWDGLVRFNLGLAQVQLGRFTEGLETFKQADRFDTPQVSRWTWLLGAGIAYTLMDRAEDALPWLQRSCAITPGTGRTDLLLAAVYQRLGRSDEAKEALARGLALRPGSTAENFALSYKNASPIFIEASQRIKRDLVAAGLPER